MHDAGAKRVGILLLLGLFFFHLAFSSVDGPLVGDGFVMLKAARGMYDEDRARELDEAGLDLKRYGLGQILLDLPVTPFLDGAIEGGTKEKALNVLALTTLPALTAALIALVMFLLVRSFGHGPGVAILLALGSSLCTMTFVYAQSLFADPTVALMWLSALLGIRRYGESRRTRWLALTGACLGFAVLTKSTGALAVPVLGLLALRAIYRGRGGRGTSLAALAVPGAILIGILLWYNVHRYGHPFTVGYIGGRDAELGFDTPLATGLFGLLLSPGKGLFFYNPVLVLSLLGIPAFLRRHRAEGVAILVLAGAWILLHAKWWSWSGDYAWGPRLVLPVVPLLLVMAAPVLTGIAEKTRAGARRLRAGVLGVAGIILLSALVQLPGLAISYHRYIELLHMYTPVFQGGFYHPRQWPIRDDLVHAHFIPEFSPLVGHAWMARAAADPDPDGLRSRPPWISLNPLWIPRGPGIEGRFRYSPFWLRAVAEDQDDAAAMAVLAATLAILGAGLLAVGVRGALRSGSRESSASA